MKWRNQRGRRAKKLSAVLFGGFNDLMQFGLFLIALLTFIHLISH